jgi:2-iminobutanoate/2-iminopropanoate deaminase
MTRDTVNPASVFNSLQYGFSQAVVARGGRRVFLSGQVGVDAGEVTVGPGLERQLDAAMDNIAAVLHAIGATLDEVAMLRIYLVEAVRNEQAVISRMLKSRFPADPPATSWVFVAGLSKQEWLVEIEAEAVL